MDTTTGPAITLSTSDRPRLARHVRLNFCRTRQRPILLHPETVVVLNDSGAAIIELCDGRRTVAQIVTELGARYRTVPGDEVRRFLARLVARRCVVLVPRARNLADDSGAQPAPGRVVVGPGTTTGSWTSSAAPRHHLDHQTHAPNFERGALADG